MPTKAAADTFLRLLDRSGIVPAERVSGLVRELGEAESDSLSAGRIADEMVQREMLTRWQADQLLDGKCKGFLLGPYRILRPLGQGGMGTVFLAEHEVMRRRCAIKVLPWKRVQAQPELVEWFRREARAVGALDHPNIVRAYDVNKAVQDDREINYLVMQYVDGQDLQRRIQEHGVADYHEAAEWIRQAAEGLSHAHEAGFVHRDIKPANLLVDSRGVVKILDLGLARFFHDEDGSPNGDQAGAVVGTADYLAPEQVVTPQDVDARADIYSLGQTFYFALTGHPPFPDGSVPQRLMAHQMKFPEPIQRQRPDVPAELVGIINRMTAKKPKDRYQTAREVSEALKKWLEGSPEISGFMRRFIRTGPSNTPPPSVVHPRPRSDSDEDDVDLDLAPIEEEQQRDEDESVSGASDSQSASTTDAISPNVSNDETISSADLQPTESPIDLSSELDDLSGPSDPLAELLASESLPATEDVPAANSSVQATPVAVLSAAAKKNGPGNHSILQSPVVWVGAASLLLVIVIVWMVASQLPSESPPLNDSLAVSPRVPVVPEPVAEEPAVESHPVPKQPVPSESVQPPVEDNKPPTTTPKPGPDSGQPKPKPKPKPAAPKPESSADNAAKPAPSQPKAAEEPKPPAKEKEAEKAAKEKESEKVDTKALFGGIEKIAFLPKSIEKSPTSKFNMMVGREANQAVERAGLTLAEDASAVMDLAVDAVPDGTMALITISGELNVLGLDEKPVKVWEHHRDLARVHPAVLRRGVPATLLPSIRQEVGAFFNKFVDDYREASGKR
ncbi:MAG: serine/threonine protein kinase [Rhodopirellula sp.]|nr:serine/threonine protein kinase [Rhodopirellula sp.]